MPVKKIQEAKAKSLVKRLKEKVGGEWKSRVWHNLGWYYSAILGSIEVHYHDHSGKYTAYVDSDKNSTAGSLAVWMDNNDSHKLPEEAVLNAMRTARDYVDKLNDTLTDNEAKMEELN